MGLADQRSSSHPLKTGSRLPDISKINALAIGSVAKVDGLAKASILDIDGVAVPSDVGGGFYGTARHLHGRGSRLLRAASFLISHGINARPQGNRRRHR